MDSKQVLLNELEANKSVFNSSANSDEKAAAFRKQFIILDQITQSSSESERISLRRSQFNEYNLGRDCAHSTFIKERSNAVEKRFGDIPRGSFRATLFSKEFLSGNKSSLEPECSGKYKSCAHEEINTDDLKIFYNVLGGNTFAQLVESPTRKVAQPSSDAYKSSKENLPTTTASGRQLSMNPFLTKNTSLQSSLQTPGFRTAREELIIQNIKKNADVGSSSNSRTLFNYGASKKSLGARRNVRSGFVPPIRQEDNTPSCTPPDAIDASPPEPTDERLRNIDPKMIELISNEIMHKYKAVGWDDIAGLEYAKATIKEAVVWPLLRPDIFTGLRRPPRGILLFGPPGTGKTLIGKCIASQSKSTFFSISASSLTSKWVGDGEKMVRALFAVAAIHQPSVVFIDEIDSLLSQRSQSEHESSRRLKTEFLVQLDGANTTDEERILIVGATNRPQELDEAARRRLVRRLYIPLPELAARIQILTNLLRTVRTNITKEEICEIGNQTVGYSGADMETLCREASMEPIRSIPSDEIESFSEQNVRPVQLADFYSALRRVRASVSQEDLQQYTNWNRIYGAGH